jgi:hypothetical protein
MEGAAMISNKPPPTLEQHIVAALDNPNAGSAELNELISETELAIVSAEADITDARAKAADVIAAPTPRDARDAINAADAAQLTRDRLNGVLPRLRDKLSAALRSEAHERWLADFKRVQRKLDEAATLFATYPEHAEAIANLFAAAAEVDKEISRINGAAPDGEHRRLRSVELEARNLTQFTLDNPSLSQTVQLRDWASSGKSLWPLTSSGSLAAAFADTMAVSYHPGSQWADPEVQQQRRADIEKQHHEIGEHYQRMTAEQEDRINREERSRRAT